MNPEKVMFGLDRTPLVCLKPKIASDRLRSLIMGMFLLIYIECKLKKIMEAIPSKEIELEQWKKLGFNESVLNGLLINGDDSMRVELEPLESMPSMEILDQDDLLSLRMDTFQDGSTGDDSRGDGYYE